MTTFNTQSVLRPVFPHGFPPRVPAHLQNTPSKPVTKPETAYRFNALSVHYSGNSHLFMLSGRPVAWILVGHHKGQQNKQPKTIRFIDVVYLRTTSKGSNLETTDFEQLPDAMAFVYGLFEGGES